MPTRYRQSLLDAADGQVILTVDRDRCLLLYPLPVWEEVERKLIRLSSVNRPRPRPEAIY
jgi:MraZ protein